MIFSFASHDTLVVVFLHKNANGMEQPISFSKDSCDKINQFNKVRDESSQKIYFTKKDFISFLDLGRDRVLMASTLLG